jgi:dCMP deaminase
MNWNEYFFSLIKVIREKSKDPHTKVGCVIVGSANEIRSTGYNSFPRGINDDVPERKERPAKYDYFEHAERNAIYNAARVGIPLDGCTIYMQGLPCVDCARAVIQAGISKIVYDKEEWAKGSTANYSSWREKIEISLEMLNEARVEVIGI